MSFLERNRERFEVEGCEEYEGCFKQFIKLLVSASGVRYDFNLTSDQ